ncbi:response regulator transcription factor [Paenibacillus antri]|uniref:Response regulator transcription factor n=1 Tax=Paenibacillus antri TaxID=2582848 RepID=A0A5R9GBJ0_9BACL|nr:response regulator transcription factor [Paenibacillus antri]TLS50738.1 response regulator transcription factor [Paenibacillus antri]
MKVRDGGVVTLKHRIAIVDDQNILVDGLSTILDVQEDMEVVGTAANGVEALELVERLRPDIVLMDIRMPLLDGVETTKRMKAAYPDVAILILSTFAESNAIVECMAHGASGFLLKDIRSAKLVESIREAIRGELVLPAAIAAKLAERLQSMTAHMEDGKESRRWKEGDIKLTDREAEIARLLLKGWNNRQIAAALYLSEGTTRNYVSAIYQKLGTNERALALVRLREALGEA